MEPAIKLSSFTNYFLYATFPSLNMKNKYWSDYASGASSVNTDFFHLQPTITYIPSPITCNPIEKTALFYKPCIDGWMCNLSQIVPSPAGTEQCLRNFFLSYPLPWQCPVLKKQLVGVGDGRVYP